MSPTRRAYCLTLMLVCSYAFHYCSRESGGGHYQPSYAQRPCSATIDSLSTGLPVIQLPSTYG